MTTPRKITLTKLWTAYNISLTGVKYNDDTSGLEYPFSFRVYPADNGNQNITFYIDAIRIVK